jgi:hypothetical protein
MKSGMMLYQVFLSLLAGAAAWGEIWGATVLVCCQIVLLAADQVCEAIKGAARK